MKNSNIFRDDIKQIRQDQTHGSSTLLAEIIRTLGDHKPGDQDLKWAYRELAHIDENMRVIHHFLQHTEPCIANDYYDCLREYKSRWSSIEENIYNNLRSKINKNEVTILTHSNSGMIQKILSMMVENGYNLHVIQTESNPGGEGEIQQQQFKKVGITSRLIQDDQIEEFMKHTDACLLGMDRYSDDAFVNKVKSGLITELAGEMSVPVYVVGDSRKKVERIKLKESQLFERIPFNKGIQLVTEE